MNLEPTLDATAPHASHQLVELRAAILCSRFGLVHVLADDRPTAPLGVGV